VPATASGDFVVARDELAPAVGSARFACSGGRWGEAAQATCAMPAPRGCAAQALSWVQGGVQCNAPAPASASGLRVVLDDLLGPAVGRASFSCSNGIWGDATAAVCAVPPPQDCPAQPLSWTVGTASCQAGAPASRSGQVQLLNDGQLPTFGQARFACSDGHWQPVITPAPQCGSLIQLRVPAKPRAPWAPPQVLPWQGP
jgi:hypothetical protein